MKNESGRELIGIRPLLNRVHVWMVAPTAS
jgi:hypothetical protein